LYHTRIGLGKWTHDPTLTRNEVNVRVPGMFYRDVKTKKSTTYLF